jgi:hypothetical protein
MRLPGRHSLVVLLATLLASLFCGTTFEAVGTPNRGSVDPGYSYDAPAYNRGTTYTAVERGPPVAIYNSKTVIAVDSGSRGVLVRPGGSRFSSQYGYDVTLLLVHDVSSPGTTSEPSQVSTGELGTAHG